MNTTKRALTLLLLASVLPASRCGDAAAPTVNCSGVERPKLDCASEVEYQGVKVEGETAVLSLASVAGSYEEHALRHVSPLVEQYVAAQTRLCRSYNACVVDAEEYRAQDKQLAERMLPIEKAAQQWSSAGYGQRKELLDGIYQAVASDQQRASDVQFELTVQARLPDALGGRSSVLRPGEPLPTGAEVAFEFAVSNDAHAYLFQKTASGAVNVLFPDPATGVTNPLRAGVRSRIPASGAYEVDAKDFGTENIYFVVTRHALPDLDGALQRVRSEQVKSIGDDALLKTFAAVVPGAAPESCSTRALTLNAKAAGPCVRSRGLVLKGSAAVSGSAPQSSVVVRNDPGDDTIVKVFPFEHVTQEAYGEAQRAYEAPTPEGGRKRGILMED